ncbi:DNA ligase D [Burkholderia glumae]|uniref:DNA ligase D n=1 Tax=Burkholderia glumae TaxID=337 RepID=UPI0001A4AFD9|nr:DNA ligase D [Burkholderia glumae]ACR28259.1 DNA primase small subunit [Burkholderia glumae BGR1]
MTDTLSEYQRKRRFDATPEPAGAKRRGAPARRRDGAAAPLRFVVQVHHARRLHYDFRLELDGVLKSWAVPKGPSPDPADKRLAIQVEDHPLDYASFEGEIPPGHYGAGSVRIDDAGVWRPEGGVAGARRGYRDGKLTFELDGAKLRGRWSLTRTAMPGSRGKSSWLLVRAHEDAAGSEPADQAADQLVDQAAARRRTRQGRPAAKPAAKRPAKPAAAQPAASASGTATALPGARRAALPDALAPQLATLVAAPPEDEGWRYEMKFDGYRVLIRIAGRGGRRSVRVLTREGLDWSAKFGAQCAAFAALPVDDAWLDAEAVVLDARGVPDFAALQRALSDGDDAAIVCFVFDLLHLDGRALQAVPLDARRARLAALLAGADSGCLRFSPTLDGAPAALLEAAARAGLEGLIGKRADGAYRAGRSRQWIKLKCRQRQEFVIGGYSAPRGSRSHFGALLLGVHAAPPRSTRRGGQAARERALQYVGRVGTGFDAQQLAALAKRLAALERERAPFAVPPPSRGDAVRWVEPRLVAECEFAGWTRDGLLRQAAFIALREDKPTARVVRETALPTAGRTTGGSMDSNEAASAGHAARRRRGGADEPVEAGQARPAGAASVAGVRITHPERVVDAQGGFRKIDVVRYYESVARWLLPQLSGRPVSLVRYMKGIGGESFFQKHAGARGMGFVTRHPGLDPGHDALMTLDDTAALVGAAQFDAIEFHTWNATVDRIERPERLVFDLDPDPALPWERMIEAAGLVRALLEALGLPAFCKTSGGKGLHVVVPIVRHTEWDDAKAFSQAVARHLAGQLPERFTAKMGPENRRGLIFVDYLRNGRGASTVAAYSARARPGMGVSVPLAWEEVAATTGGAQWTIANLSARLDAQRADPWDGYDAARTRITAAMRKRLGER